MAVGQRQTRRDISLEPDEYVHPPLSPRLVLALPVFAHDLQTIFIPVKAVTFISQAGGTR